MRDEWGVFGAADKLRWLRQWIPFGLRVLGYGVISLTLGPLTQGRASAWAAKTWSQVSIRKLGIALDARGFEREQPGGLVYASNHQSLIDALVLGSVLPQDYKWAAKRSLMNIPVLGWHLRLAGHVPVDRQSGKEAAITATEAFAKVLRSKERLLVFPEGTRSIDGHLKPFKLGAFHAAVKAGCPVVPIALDGTFSLLSKHDADIDADDRRPVSVRSGEPLEPDMALPENERVTDLRDRAHASVEAMLSDIRGDA